MAAPTAATWKVISEVGLNQELDAISTTQHYPLGHKVVAKDVGTTARGEGEFVYWCGVASVAAGDMCHFDGGVVARSGAASLGPVGVAMAAIVASTYGWFQIRGKAIVTADSTCADNGQVYTNATAGAASTTLLAGQQVIGARVTTAVDTGYAIIDLMYPSVGNVDDA